MIPKDLSSITIQTIIGPMFASADSNFLYTLEFLKDIDINKNNISIYNSTNIIIKPLESIKIEIADYFAGKITKFQTPYKIFGSTFQQQVWTKLCSIPYGTTCSYAKQAQDLGNPKAYRAVANANGANKLAIIIPCHRVIASNGALGGYAYGLKIKQWLLQHEKRYS